MSKLFKILTLAIVLTLSLTLAACGKDDSGNSELLEEDKTTLMLADDLRNLVDNITLPTTGKNGSTVTWSSSNTDALANDGTVTRPANGEGDAVLTLTATLTLDGESVTKDFKVRVLEAPEEIGVTVAGVLAQSKGTQVVLKGVTVFGIIDDGYYVYDSTGFMFVFGTPSDDVNIGDKVNLMGGYTIYYDQPELEKPSGYTVVSSDNTLPTPEVTTIADIVAYDTTNKAIYAKYLQVEGFVNIDGQDAYIVDGEGNKLQINYKSEADAVKEYEGKKVRINLVLHTYRSDAKAWRMSFLDLDGDIEEVVLTEQEQLNNAKESLSLRKQYASNIELPTSKGNVAISWSSSNAAVLANDGTVVRPTDATVEVTLTATLTIGDLTETKEITVKIVADVVKDLETVLDTYTKGDLVDVEGIVYGVMSKGYFLYDGTGFIYVYTNDEPTVEEGDQVKVTGEYTIYNEQPEIQYVSNTAELTDGTYTLPTSETKTVADLNDYEATDKEAYGMPLTIVGKIIKEVDGNYTNWYIEDLAENRTMIYYGSDVADVESFENKYVSINVIVYRYSSGWQVSYISGDALAEATVTEQNKLDAVKAEVSVPEKVTDTLSLTSTLGGVNIVWTSNNNAIAIAEDGTVTVTQPESGDLVVTLTATFTIGDLSETKDYTVTVKDLEAPVVPTDLFFSEYIEGSASNKAIEIYNGTGSTIDLSTYTVVLFTNGASQDPTDGKHANFLNLTGTLASGEVLVIANSGADQAILDVADVTGDDYFYGWNGDDALVLFKNYVSDTRQGDVVDSIGVVGTDPGTKWVSADGAVSTQDMSIVRKGTITSGDVTVSDEFDPSVEWVGNPKDTFTNLGSHSIDD
jgi:predicted extracellular nuclease